MSPLDDVVVHARFLVVREMPMVVVDLEGDEPALPLVDDNLFRTLVERGLVVLPGFYGVDLPRGARIGWTLERQELRLEDEQAVGLLRVPRPSVDPVWEAASLRLKGTMFCAAWNLGLDPDLTDRAVCDALHTAATAGRVAGAIVGVAEPSQGLPLFFG